MNWDIFITALIGVFTSGATGFLTWIFSRKKYNAEVSHDEIVNMKESLDFYKDLSESNQRTLADILNKSEELANTNIRLLMEVQNLKVQIGVLLQIINTELGDIDFSKYGIKVENGTVSREKTPKE